MRPLSLMIGQKYCKIVFHNAAKKIACTLKQNYTRIFLMANKCRVKNLGITSIGCHKYQIVRSMNCLFGTVKANGVIQVIVNRRAKCKYINKIKGLKTKRACVRW